jgi:hypothetical protein
VQDLADILWDTRETFASARSLVHVGTAQGYGYFAIREYARSVNPGILCRTSDASNSVRGEVTGTHDDVMHPHVVVLNGQQSYVDFTADFRCVNAHTLMCVITGVHGAWWWDSFCDAFTRDRPLGGDTPGPSSLSSLSVYCHPVRITGYAHGAVLHFPRV